MITICRQKQGLGILIFFTILKNKASSDIMHTYYTNKHIYTSNTDSISIFTIHSMFNLKEILSMDVTTYILIFNEEGWNIKNNGAIELTKWFGSHTAFAKELSFGPSTKWGGSQRPATQAPDGSEVSDFHRHPPPHTHLQICVSMQMQLKIETSFKSVQ